MVVWKVPLLWLLGVVLLFFSISILSSTASLHRSNIHGFSRLFMHLLITYSILPTLSYVCHYLCLYVARHIKGSQWLQFCLILCPQIHHSFTFSLFSRTISYQNACYFTLQEEVILNILAKCYLFSLEQGTLSRGKAAGAWSWPPTPF